LARFTLPGGSDGVNVRPVTIVPKGMLYHPTFGLMSYGPQATSSINQPPTFVPNPSVEPSGLASNFIIGTSDENAVNYAKFVPDVAGVSLGNHATLVPWLLTPSCDWDLANLP
jgi:hypothetical protein